VPPETGLPSRKLYALTVRSANADSQTEGPSAWSAQQIEGAPLPQIWTAGRLLLAHLGPLVMSALVSFSGVDRTSMREIYCVACLYAPGPRSSRS
jgi:hypothetical protein